MPLDFFTGFEHRVLDTAGNGLFTGLIGSLTPLSIDTSVLKFGSASLKVDIASAGGELYYQLSSDSNQVVVSLTWRPSATRSTAFQPAILRVRDSATTTGISLEASLINTANGNNALHLKTFSAGTNISDDTLSVNPVNGTWYDIEIKIDATTNPWQLTWRIKETDSSSWTEQSFQSAIAATNFRYVYIGTNDVASGYAYNVDQYAVARAHTAYLHPFKILGYSPNAVGTHSVDAATSQFFKKDIGGTETALGNSGDTTSYQQIDDVPLNADSDHVLVRASGAANTYADPNGNGTNTAWTGDFTGIDDGVRDPTDAQASGDGASISSGTAGALEDTAFSNPTYVAGATYTLKIFSGSGAKRGLSVSVNAGGAFTTVHGASETPQWHNVDVTSQITNQTTLDAFTARWRVDSTAGGGGAGVVTIYAAYLEISPPVTQPTNTWYLEYGLADSSETADPTAVRGIVALKQDAAANCSITAKLRANGNESNIFSGDINSATTIYKSALFNTDPAGSAWTDTNFDGATLRWGYTNDADGTPHLEAVMFEVLFPIASTTPKAGADSGSGADSSAEKGALPRAESGTGADSSVEKFLTTRTESGVGADASFLRQQKAGADSGSGGAQASTLHAALPRTDSGSGADSIKAKASVAAQAGSGADASSEHAAYARADSGTSAETSKVSRPVADTGAGVDASASRATYARTDAGAGADVTSEHAAYARTETGAGADVSSVTRRYAVTQSGTGTDTSVEKAAYARAETGSGSDSSALQAGNAKHGTDAATGVDSSLLVARITRTDAGTGADSSTLSQGAIAKAGSDAGSGVDSSALRASLSRSEGGICNDLGALHASLSRADAGTYTEASRLAFRPSDTGTSADASIVRTLHLVSQTANVLEVAQILFLIGQRMDSGAGTDHALVFKGGLPPERATASITQSRIGSTMGLNRGGEASTIAGEKGKAEVERWP